MKGSAGGGGGAKGIMVFLDWSTVFDRVRHPNLWESMHAHGVGDTLVAAVHSLY